LNYPTRYQLRIYVTVKIHQPLISMNLLEGPIYAEGLYRATTKLLIFTVTKRACYIFRIVALPRENLI